MTLESHSRSEASHMFDKIKQKMCENVSKGAPQLCCRQRTFKIKWLQTIYNVKLTFTQKQIPRQNKNVTCFQWIKFFY